MGRTIMIEPTGNSSNGDSKPLLKEISPPKMESDSVLGYVQIQPAKVVYVYVAICMSIIYSIYVYVYSVLLKHR